MVRASLAVGVDLGGTKVAVGLVDADGGLVRRTRRTTDVQAGPEAITAQIAAAVKELRAVAGPDPICVGVGVAGQVEPDSGRVRFAPNLKWQDVPLGRLLREALGLPVAVTNDVRAATWGEWLHGAGQGCDHLVCVFVGTGIGGGVVTHGRVLEGYAKAAGELGHMTVALGGPECTCGNR
ncbi:MAG: ROK family protein, partial [Proteobacteria bacterium]|nr:ROK family protein [Pseudomonadota bacterium]